MNVKKLAGLVLVASALVLSACITSSDKGDKTLTEDLERFVGLPEDTTVSGRTIVIRGETYNGSGDSGYIVVSNGSHEVRTLITVVEGSFTQVVELTQGENSIRVVILQDGRVLESARFTVETTAPTPTARIRLEWDRDYGDIDLYVKAPSGGEAFYRNKEIPTGFLDIDDVDGYGPETFSVLVPESGNYTVRVNYYASHGQMDSVRATVRLSRNGGAWETLGTHTFSPDDANQGATFWTVTSTLTVP